MKNFLVQDNPRELSSLYNTKINQIKMIYNRGYVIPDNELRMIDLKRSKKGRIIPSNEEYTITDFKAYYLAEEEHLLDNVYFRFSDDGSGVFKFEEDNDKEFMVIPLNTPNVEIDNKTKPENFGHIETENGRIYAKQEFYDEHFEKHFQVLVVRYPKTKIKKDGKVEKPNADTLEMISNAVPEYLLVNKMYILRNSLTSKGEQKRKQITNLEVFIYDDLIIDIVSHVLVPEHVLLSEKEAFKIKAVFGVENMSHISYEDRITKYYDAKIGDVFLILRREFVHYGPVLEKEHYRVVVYTL